MLFDFIVKPLIALVEAIVGAFKDAEEKFSKKEPGKAKEECPLKDKIKLVEFVEVVTRGGTEGVVQTPGPASAKLATVYTRTAVEAGKYQQFINMDKDVEGADKRRPDYGRWIEVKARVEWVAGDKTRSLAGKKVELTHVLTKDAKRPAVMKDPEKEGYSGSGGAAKEWATCDAEGWTTTTHFYLSQFGGDCFSVEAQADEDDKGKPSGAKLKIENYQVWRRFWYQLTSAEGFVPPSLATSTTAFKKVFAVMEKDDQVSYKKADVPAKTFYPEWMVKYSSAGGDKEVGVIGNHNKAYFHGLFNPNPAKPVKLHLIVCEHQWDPAKTATALQTHTISKTPSDELEVASVDVPWNSGIITPPLSGDLVASGTYTSMAPSPHADFGKTGNLTSADIQILKGRTDLLAYKVKLPAGAPDPTVHPVQVQLTFNYGKFYAGESVGFQILITSDGTDKAYNNVVSHEIGHAVYQTPRDGVQTKKPLSLPDHPKFYTDNRGGQGPHCWTEATSVVDPAYPDGRYKDGSCIMFHQSTTACKDLFCDSCDPYLKLQDMSALKPAT